MKQMYIYNIIFKKMETRKFASSLDFTVRIVLGCYVCHDKGKDSTFIRTTKQQDRSIVARNQKLHWRQKQAAIKAFKMWNAMLGGGHFMQKFQL